MTISRFFDIYATKLKNLTIENLELDDAGDDGLRQTKLRVFAPNLLSFKYIGPVALDHILHDPLCVVNVYVHLVNVFEKGSLKPLGYMMCKFIGGFYNVEVMNLSIKFLETTNRKDEWQAEDEAIKCLACHLKAVEISNFEGQDNGLEFIKFILKNGLVLEKIAITWSITLEKPIEIIQKTMTIMTFPRASSAVAITFLKPKPSENSFG